MSDPSDQITFALSRLAVLWRAEVWQAAAAEGLNPAQAEILGHLARRGPVRQVDLVTALGVSAASLSDSVASLVAKGLVTRQPDPDDGRARRVGLSASGPEIAERLMFSGVEVQRLAQAVELDVESFQVTDRRPSNTFVEGRITHRVTTEVAPKKVRFPAGSYVFPMAQPNANVIAVALEPESPSSFVSFGMIPVDKKGSPPTGSASSEVPVYRVLRPVGIETRAVRPLARPQ